MSSGSTAGWRARRRFSGTADRPAIQGRPVEPDLSARTARDPSNAPQTVRKLLPSAHAVDREFRVIAALGKQGFRWRKPMRLCNRTIPWIGGYLTYVDGRGGAYSGRRCRAGGRHGARSLSARSRRCKLHQYDQRKESGSASSASPEIITRQVDRWTKPIRAPRPAHSRGSRGWIGGLPKTVPNRSASRSCTGYRLANMIFHATEPRVNRVWTGELSTLGDPMAISLS